MDFSLTDEQQMIVDTVRAFVERELIPHEETVERDGRVDPALAATVRSQAIKLGLYAPNMPEEWGGGGLDAVTCTLMEREFGRTSYALNYIIARPSNILRICTPEQRKEYLFPTIRGQRLECLAMTEPEAGSDLRSMKTVARPDGDDFVINGQKHFISKADIADYVILFASTGTEEETNGKRSKVTAFLVDMGTAGFTVRPGYEMASHRGYNNCILEFDDCRVPKRNVLGDIHKGFDVANRWLSSTRLQLAAMCVGRAGRALELATEYAAQRQQFGQPIGRFQGVSFNLADMATEFAAADALVLKTAWKLGEDSMTVADAAAAKLYATEMLGRVADRAVQIFGGMGLAKILPIERIWRDARLERIWDGTSEIQRHIIARALLRPYGA